MNKETITIALIALLTVGAYVVYQEYMEDEFNDGLPVYRVALLTSYLEYHTDVNDGFYAACEQDKTAHYRIVKYDASTEDLTMIRSIAQTVLQKKYDIVVTVGGRFSQIMAYHLRRVESTTPMVFIGVAEPVKNGCIDDEECPGVPITGVRAAEDESFDTQVRMLRLIYPGMKRLLLARDSIGDLGAQTREADAITQYCHDYGIDLISREIYQAGATMDIIRNDLRSVDAMIITAGSVASVDYAGVIKLCNQYDVVLCAGDLRAVNKGAAIGYGPDPYFAGQRGFVRMRDVLTGAIDPATHPIERIPFARKVILNLPGCRNQGFEPDRAIKLLMNARVKL
jgi:ABC-type uncharacterized transport system substrate-binding protein